MAQGVNCTRAHLHEATYCSTPLHFNNTDKRTLWYTCSQIWLTHLKDVAAAAAAAEQANDQLQLLPPAAAAVVANRGLLASYRSSGIDARAVNLGFSSCC
jgi:hypothetical protein